MSKPPDIWNDSPIWVDEWTIRRRFNEAQIHERAERGELQVRIIGDRHPSRAKAREPYCTRSQAICYFELDGKPVAMAHRYLRVDGTLGASGRPDPMRYFDGPTLLAKKLTE